MCHQGNDFQITEEFWTDLNDLTREFDQPGRFIFFPGYEWSGNTALGGDRNVVLKREGHTLHRSSHAMVEDVSDANLDTLDVKALHAVVRLEGDVLCLPHVGGRYANLLYTHDKALERSVEVHSDWGTSTGCWKTPSLSGAASASPQIPMATRDVRARRTPAHRCSAPMAASRATWRRICRAMHCGMRCSGAANTRQPEAVEHISRRGCG